MAYTTDSYHSWIIVAASHIIHFFLFGMFRVGGLLYVEAMAIYQIDRETASIPFVIAYTLRCLSGPLSGYLINVLGFRPVISFGCVLAAVGVGICCFAKSITFISFVWGGLFGLGCGLASSSLPQLVNLNFKKHASKANGVSLSGVSVAGFVLSPIVSSLLDTYGLSGTFLIMSALMMNMLPASLLLRVPTENPSKNDKIIECQPLNKKPYISDVSSSPKKYSEIEKGLHIDKENGSHLPLLEITGISKEPLTERTEGEITKTNLNPVSTVVMCINEKQTPVKVCASDVNNSLCESSKQCLNENGNTHKQSSSNRDPKKQNGCLKSFSIFLDPTFIFISIPRCFSNFFFLMLPTIIVDFSRDKNLTKPESVYVLMLFSGCDLFGKLCLGWIVDGKYIASNNYCAICFIIISGFLAFITWAEGFAMMLIGVAGISLCVGTLSPTFPLLVRQYMAKEKQTMAMASSLFLMVPLNFSTTPLIGYFRDHLGSYDWLLYTMSIICVICMILLISLASVSKYMQQRKKSPV
ncbi:hypothetical protein TNIN_151101 [Trichonephila inaurata madagascariensis]|uniref:Monocarboxylate transporter n=1 Tax=Trichonephila inaurata madagascariensis TaxID=2747483 RepID=A0A8X6YDK2_9ARAC|nr:hypothetical protein TNIN_151101 [Trichonephila inaurata madagascariensis]